MSEPTTEQIGAVFIALENPKYLWRSPEGIADETGLSLGVVLWVLYDLKGQVVKHPAGSTDGRDLYTTGAHFRKKASMWQRLNTALKYGVA